MRVLVMKSYTALIIVGVITITGISTILVIDIGSIVIATTDYALRVDPIIDKQNLFTVVRISIQNIGREELTGVMINFGGGDTLRIGTLDAGQNMIISPPADSAMEMVVVTTDEGLIVTKVYREPPKMVGMMGS